MGDILAPTIAKLRGFVEGFFWILPNLGIALVVLVLFTGLAWAARRAVVGVSLRRGRRDLGVLLGGFVRVTIIVIGALIACTIVFPSVKPADLLATLGVGSVAVGFAFRDILQNWLAGMLILYRQPFRRGDEIRSGDFEGRVEAVEARATLLRTADGQRVVIPNSDIYTRAVTIRTAWPIRRSEYDIGIGYGDDIRRAIEVMLSCMQGVEGVAPSPAPEALPWALTDSTVDIRLRWWTGSALADVNETRGRVVHAVKAALTKAGIDLPFPTSVVLLHDQTEEVDGDRRQQREGWPAGQGDTPRPARRATAQP